MQGFGDHCEDTCFHSEWGGQLLGSFQQNDMTWLKSSWQQTGCCWENHVAECTANNSGGYFSRWRTSCRCVRASSGTRLCFGCPFQLGAADGGTAIPALRWTLVLFHAEGDVFSQGKQQKLWWDLTLKGRAASGQVAGAHNQTLLGIPGNDWERCGDGAGKVPRLRRAPCEAGSLLSLV